MKHSASKIQFLVFISLSAVNETRRLGQGCDHPPAVRFLSIELINNSNLQESHRPKVNKLKENHMLRKVNGAFFSSRSVCHISAALTIAVVGFLVNRGTLPVR